MKHICIYTTIETFNHKREGGIMYWEFRNTPKIYQKYEKLFNEGKKDNEVFDEKPRIYFAYKGFIHGYFTVVDWDGTTRTYIQIHFDSDTWTEIKPIPTKPHRGFKYIIHIA